MTTRAGPLTAAEAIARARELVPVLSERAAKTEGLRRLPDETFADLLESGLLGISQPRRLGGSELTLADAFDVINLLSQGCGSTGWTYALLAAHGWFLAQFGDQAQRDVWGAEPDAVLSASFSGGPGPEPVEGGLRLTEGRWRFSSGVHHANWVALLAPVPLHRTLRMRDLLDATGPGRSVNDGSLYKLPLVGCWHVFVSAPATGIARGAMDAWVARTKGRVHPFTREPVGADPVGRVRLGAAAARIEAAESLIRGAVERATTEVLDHGAVSAQTQVRGRRDHAFGVRLCVEAVEDLFLAAGASSLDASSPIQRHWRDVHAVAQHVANNFDSNLSAWGDRALGLGDGLRFG